MLRELAWAFLKLGLTAFGGPAAHIAMMENEFVRRRQWLAHERFLDLLGAANLIPGPSSSELAIYIGYERAGWRGLLVAGAAFVLPAALMVTAIAWAYVHFGSLPQLGGVLYGVKPVVIAVVVQALWGLAPKAVPTRGMGALAALAGVAIACGLEALAVLVGAGALSLALHRMRHRSGDESILALFAPALALGGSSFSLVTLFLTFVKMGAIVFGSGYVLLAFLRADFVDRLHWLTEAQLLDAVAVGQITPGPVFTTATFIGYVIAGPAGAAVSTVGIFLPGFVLVAATRPILGRMRRSPGAGAFLDGVNAATLALMAVVTVQLARSALVDAVTAILAVAGAVLLVRFKVNTTWLVLGGALAGVAVRALG
ncbi:chromate efflux transporter [Pendulispora rubella]|uniref:Chromate efflux transporter n=1 Tax=Pendulispora rubella TaxID=2741070 RepID=A0ABZ2LIR9_9BACT